MNSILNLCAAVSAIAFCALVYYAIQTLKALKISLEGMNKSLERMEKQMHGLSNEATCLLEKSNRLIGEANNKVAKLDVFFDAVKDLGGSISEVAQSIQKVSNSFVSKLEDQGKQVASYLSGLSFALDFVEKLKNRKKD